LAFLRTTEVVVEVADVMTMMIDVTVTEVLKRGDIENKEAGLK